MTITILQARRLAGAFLRRVLTTAGVGATTAWARPRIRVHSARLGQLAFGLVALGIGVGMLLAADLGASSFDVLNVALSTVVDVPLSVTMWLTGGALAATGMLLGGRPGFGTLAPVATVGPVVQATMEVLAGITGPPAWLVAATGIVTIATGAGAYLTAGYGRGAAELVYGGLADRGVPRWASRLGVEGAALTGGWLLGGPVGPATVVAAVSLAWLIPWSIDLFAARGVARRAPAAVEATA